VLIGIDEIFTSLFARPGAATLRPRCVAFVAGGGKLDVHVQAQLE
jgi:hypothetical protein